MTLVYPQQHIIDLIRDLSTKGYELTAAGANISFKPHAMAALIKKGLVKEVARTYPNGSHYTAYELVSK
jgi:hypothetical protein